MKRIHYGWFVCLGCAMLLFCTSGLCINAFTIYQPYILKQNGFTNTQSSSIIAVRSLFSFISMLLTGAYYRRFSLRTGMTAAGLLVALGFFLFGSAQSYAAYCFAAVVIGFGYGFGTMIPVAIVLEHWFVLKRTFALSLCSAVTGLAILGIPSLLTWMIETYSLRLAFHVEAAFIAAFSLVTFLLVRDTPAQKNAEPYGAGMAAEIRKTRRHARGIGKKDWLLLAPMLLLIGAMTNVGYSHLTVLATSEGFDSHTAALAITITGVTLILGKCAYGMVSEKLGAYRTNWIFGAILTAGMALCCVIRGGKAILFAAMCLYGAGLAMTTVGLTAWAGDLSAPEQYDRTVRRFQLGYAAGGLVFSSFPGVLADCFGGSYIPAYIFFVACTVYVIIAIQHTYRRAGGRPCQPDDDPSKEHVIP